MTSRRATTTLWRPTGPEELALVRESNWRAWPPRLPEQPIFYPVLNDRGFGLPGMGRTAMGGAVQVVRAMAMRDSAKNTTTTIAGMPKASRVVCRVPHDSRPGWVLANSSALTIFAISSQGTSSALTSRATSSFE
ncbi:hypothetical protein EBO15_39090 [Actinomadura harenae]|uniref:Uncharacterized protein n=1 Tax=Actinomadura harenae TaxID=2483351 RepID=A0A3M2LFK9_9ACTN|nr:hypothetical protein EBO15_39090 [Actinomadura harenae]